MTLWIFFAAAALLSVERIAYLWIWYKPEAFRRLCRQPVFKLLDGPVDALKALFYSFKGIQAAVFFLWCYIFGGGELLPRSIGGWHIGLGILFIALGQLLNWRVFALLGKNGVFYGNRFGYRVEWRDEFPFSLFEHPQYAGALLSIWGLFLIMRFPHDDWYWLPALETLYYGIGAYLERDVEDDDEAIASTRRPSQD